VTGNPHRLADLAAPGPNPREICARCTRPTSVCVCGLAPALATRTRVLFLQHPRERRTAIGTARLAHLGLPQSSLRVGLDFSADPVVTAAVAATPRPYVLFPGEGATDVHSLPQGSPINLIVLDGTWTQAKKLLRLNPQLAALPRLAFSPRRPSGYAIRRQPAEFCVSTIEALGEVLSVLEPEGAGIERLLDPFFAMVARQQRFAAEVRSSRHRRSPDESVRREPAGLLALRAAWARIVVVHGEANAWPRRHRDWRPAEIVHWVGHRLADGSTYEAVIAPRSPLAPNIAEHVGLSPAELAAGGAVAAWQASWAKFIRPDDLFVTWGGFAHEVALRDGLHLSRPFDLRGQTAQWTHRKAGPIEGLLALVGAGPGPAPLARGRGGLRAAQVTEVLRAISRIRPFLPR
jgi:DTW domain-containing protein